MHSQILSNDLKEFAAQRITSPHPNCLISIVWSCIQFALWCLQLSDTAQIIWMATSCALQCMFHNLRKLMHTFSICLPSWERQQPHAGFRQGSLCLLHFGHAGWPHAFVPGDEGGVGVCVRVCVEGVTRSLLTASNTAAESSHLLCPLSAFHTASVPDWSMTPEPEATPPSLHPNTHPKAVCFLLVDCYSKEVFSKFAAVHLAQFLLFASVLQKNQSCMSFCLHSECHSR